MEPIYNILCIVLVFAVSLIVSSLAHQPVLRYAKRHNIYDNPEARKLQRVPIPVMGGFVVFLGLIVGSLCYWIFRNCTSIIPVQVAMLIMLVVGGWDDVKKLSPSIKFIIEILVVTVLALVNGSPINDLHGLWGFHEITPWVAWPLTIFGCVGIINAINMIDGIDGLSSGMCIMVFGFFGLLFLYCSDFPHIALSAAIIGGLIPFFIMNVFGNKSKMFIGDAGTLMLGIALCDMVMSMLTIDSRCSQNIPKNFCTIAFALAVLAIPVFDTVRVMLGRICRKESPFYPDKTHLHHAFIDYGFHHLETALIEIILNMMIIGIWWMFYKMRVPNEYQLYAVIVIGISVCFGLYYMLGRRKRIAQKVKEMYGISMDVYENMTDEEREQLKTGKQS